MLDVLIIEDEVYSSNRLVRMLNSIDENILVKGQLTTIHESILWLKSNEHPKVIFMDIMLTDGLIFEIFSHIPITSYVVFTTAYGDYALRAFEVKGLDYLLKPILVSKLEKCIDRINQFSQAERQSAFPQILSPLNKIKHKTRFLVFSRDIFVLVYSEDIAYFYCENKVNFIVKHNGEKYIADHTLDNLVEQLDPDMFFRISRQYIVSMKSIDKLVQSFNSQLKVQFSPGNNSILMSRRKSKLLKEWLES